MDPDGRVAVACPVRHAVGARGAQRHPHALGARKQALIPALAIGADGSAAFAWQRSTPDRNSTRSIQARLRSATGRLGPIVDVSDPRDRDATRPVIASTAHGGAFVVWMAHDGTRYRIRARTISAQGTLGPITDLSATRASAEDPQLVTTARGTILVAWHANRVQARLRSPAGRLGPIVGVSPAGLADDTPVSLATGRDGAVAVVWTAGPHRHQRVALRLLSPAGRFGPIAQLSAADRHAVAPRVAIDEFGNALVDWFDRSEPNASAQVLARQRTRSGRLGPIVAVSPADESAAAPAAPIAADRFALIAWAGLQGPNTLLDTHVSAAVIGLTDRPSEGR